MNVKQKVLNALKDVVDPELGLSVVDLGLIYDLKVVEKKVKIKMTLTAPTCPFSAVLVSSVEDAIRGLGLQPEVDIVFSPPWTPKRMSAKARKVLHL